MDLKLHPKQFMALSSEADELFFGGAAGGGKSYLIRVVASVYADQIPGCQVYLFRKVLPDLIKTHVDGPGGFRTLLADWIDSGKVQIVGEEIRFSNGSKIYLCHCQDDTDRFKYLSADINVLLVDELTTFNEVVYRFLRSRVRAGEIQVPAGFKFPFPRIICGSNPSGIGHTWVRRTFVSPEAPYALWRAPRAEGGMLRQYIPSLLEDNPSIDSGYEARLHGLGSDALVNAYRYGFWDQVEGAFLDCFGPKNVVSPIELPPWWNRSMAFDWGSYDPFSFGWYAVVGKEGYKARDGRGETVELPSGAGICYRGWYGADKQGKGLKLTPSQIAQGLRGREAEKISYRITGKDCFAHRGGPSIAELFAKEGFAFRPGDNNRIAGWTEFRRRIVGDERGPLLYWFESCRDEIENIPLLQHDENNPEDAADGNDHIPEQTRLWCMSRPLASAAPRPVQEQTIQPKMPTINDLWAARDRQLRRSRSYR